MAFLFPPGEDSSSDLSSDSPVWSEDESDAELDLNMPLSEQAVETVTHGSEIVRCICEVQEENDFMIQVNDRLLFLVYLCFFFSIWYIFWQTKLKWKSVLTINTIKLPIVQTL